MTKLYKLNIFDTPPYVDREALAALIQDQMAPQIFQGTVEQSVVLSMGTRLPDMTSRQTRLPILDALPIAYFLDADESQKQVTTQKWKNKNIVAAEVAVIVPFSQAAADDADYDVVGQVTPRLSEAAGRAIDAAVLFGTGKPTFWPDGILPQAESAGATVEASTNLFDDLLGVGGVISKVEESGYFATGHIGAISMRAALRGVKDNDGRPIFLNSMQQAGNYTLDGAPINFPRNGSFDASKAQLVTGDFSQLVYAIRQDLTIDVFTEGVIQDGDGKIVYNLMQNDMFAIRMVMRLGWELPNPVNGINQTESRFPFAVLKPKAGAYALRSTGTSVPVNTAANDGVYDEAALNKMTIPQIQALAAGLGYNLTASNKSPLIAEFLTAQAAAANG